MKSCIKERRGRVEILKGKINQNFWNQTKNTKIIIKKFEEMTPFGVTQETFLPKNACLGNIMIATVFKLLRGSTPRFRTFALRDFFMSYR